MNTLTAQTTIELPTTTDAEFIEYGSSRTFAVCVVDGGNPAARPYYTDDEWQPSPPAWLTERPVVEVIRSPKADPMFPVLLGRGTVEHVLPVYSSWAELSTIEPPFVWVMPSRYVMYLSEDGKHDQLLDISVTPGQYVALIPVVDYAPSRKDLPEQCIEVWPERIMPNGDIWLWLTAEQKHAIPLDITVSPGQYVALIRLID